MASLMPVAKQQFFFPGTALPLVGGTLYTYAAGTSTPKTTWQDSAGTTPNTNPITLDSTGSALIYWTGNYKIVLKDALGNTVYTVDNYNTDLVAAFQAQLGTSAGAPMIGSIQDGVGAVLETLQARLRERKTPKGYGGVGDGVTNDSAALLSVATAVSALGGGEIDLLGLTWYVPAGIYDFSSFSNVTFKNGTIKGPAIAAQGQPSAGFKFWGTAGTAVAFGSTIPIGTSSFAVANSFTQGQLLLLSNFPTDASDAYTNGTPDQFGRIPRNYATVSTANLRQTRRKELLYVKSGGASLVTYTGTERAYNSTASLQFQPVTGPKNVIFQNVTFQNVDMDFWLCDGIAFRGCRAFASLFNIGACINVDADFSNFDAQNTDCRLDFYEACKSLNVRGSYRNMNTPADNAIIKFSSCTDFHANVLCEGVTGSLGHGVQVDTNFTENPSGYTDMECRNYSLDVSARSCNGLGVYISCDPYAALNSYGQVILTSNDCGLQLKGCQNVDAITKIDYADVSGNSVYVYGASQCTINGRNKGSYFEGTVTNPRNGGQTTSNFALSIDGGPKTIQNQPSFVEYLTTNQINVTGDGTLYAIPMGTTIANRSSSVSNGVFTAPITGLYRFDGTASVMGLAAGNTSGWLALITTQGTYYIQANFGAARDSNNQTPITGSWLVPMNKGDTANLQLKVAGGTKIVGLNGTSTLQTYWSGSLVC